MDARDRAVRLFRARYGDDPSALLRAPGRVNLIGEHTDYNDGFVLPAAIDRDLCVAIRPRSDPVVDVSSEGREPASIRIDRFEKRAGGWAVYVQGVAWALTEAGLALRGWDGAVASDIPVGAGLSSSAAMEIATAGAFRVTSGFDWEPIAVAQWCRRAENEWVGLASGLMDQLACAGGRRGHALLLDCRSLETEWVPLPDDVVVVVLDTGTRRDLGSSAYNVRRRECEEAARRLDVGSLRDATPADLERRSDRLARPLLRRARHVITENARTMAAADALRRRDVVTVGRLMGESHRSLRDDFEVSSEALDAIVEAAAGAEGCYGARLTGGGFAGCAVALVDRTVVSAFEAAVAAGYAARTGRSCRTLVCEVSDGASAVPIAGAG